MVLDASLVHVHTTLVSILFNLLLFVHNVLDRSIDADGIRIRDHNQARVGAVISVDIFQAPVCCRVLLALRT